MHKYTAIERKRHLKRAGLIPPMTHAEYMRRHERRPAWQRADTWWTVAIVIGLFALMVIAEAVAPGLWREVAP